jgi:hypothetical protein
MKIPVFIAMGLFVCTGCTNSEKTKIPDQSKPNIVFILTDDQAWNVLGRDGRYPFMKTPNIDRLADEGMVFENAFVVSSVCSPSRASFLTGSYPHTHGVYVNAFSDPDPSVPFFPKVLQETGYETAFIGKWHMDKGSHPREGFDYWLGFDGQGLYIDPPLNENGREFVEKGYMTDILTDYAIRWMQKPRENRFVCFSGIRPCMVRLRLLHAIQQLFPVHRFRNTKTGMIIWRPSLRGKEEPGFTEFITKITWKARENRFPRKLIPIPGIPAIQDGWIT